MRLSSTAVLFLMVLSCSGPSESPISFLTDNPLPKHWASVHVVLAEPLPINGGPETAVGYYQNFGLACPVDSVRELVEQWWRKWQR